MIAAFFDFDGTVTFKDSMKEFLKFSLGSFAYYRGFLLMLPLLVAYKLNIISGDRAKELLFTFYFKGWESEKFNRLSESFADACLTGMIRIKALERIEWHKNQGHKVVFVTGSIESWLKKWCDKNGIELIATKLENVDGRLTGKFMRGNCNGIEKAHRICEAFNLNLFKYIYAYGDSEGDSEMLALADEQYFKPFRD